MKIDGLDIFYREAVAKDAIAVLLLHGFPTSSHIFRNLIPGADQTKFEKLAGMAKTGCPVSKLFKADITLDTKLVS